jgi:hypothetical protein
LDEIKVHIVFGSCSDPKFFQDEGADSQEIASGICERGLRFFQWPSDFGEGGDGVVGDREEPSSSAAKEMVIEEQEETLWVVGEERECLSCDLSRGGGMAGR